MKSQQISDAASNKQVCLWQCAGNILTIALIALTLTCLFSYWSILSTTWLLDERFLISFLHDPNNFANWFDSLYKVKTDSLTGLAPLSVFSLMVSAKLFGHSLFFWRLKSLAIHIVSTVLVFLVVRKLPIAKSFVYAFFTAFLFALYPLHAEAVFWIGGRAFSLSTLFFLAAFYCYLKAKSFQFTNVSPATSPSAHKLTIKWSWLSAGLFAYFLCLISLSSMYLGIMLIAAFECVNAVSGKDNKDKESLLRTGTCLGAFLVATLIGLGCLGGHANWPSLAAVASFKNWYHLFLNLFLPIDRLAGAHYSREIRNFMIVLALPLIAYFCALWKNKDERYVSLLSVVWLIISVLPFLGQAAFDYTLSGERALYLASLPVCLLMATILISFSELGDSYKPLWQKIGLVASAIFLLFCACFYLTQLASQLKFYKQESNTLNSIEKSLRTVIAKNNIVYVYALDIPAEVAIDNPWKPILKQGFAVCFDGNTGLLAAPQIPDGHLKDAIVSGDAVTSTYHFDKDSEGFISLDLTPKDNQFGLDLDGSQVADKLLPPLQYYRNVTLDAPEKCLTMESNSANGPVIRLNGDGLSPLAGDFFYVDCRIQAPEQSKPPEIELYWTTRSLTNYDHKLRRATCSTTINDNQYHRYYLPLRSLGWFSNGPIAAVMLGFPAGAKVSLKGIGITNGGERLPKLSLTPALSGTNLPTFVSPFFRYPNNAALGLGQKSASASAIKLDYDLRNIPGAKSALVEISQPNKGFANPNGDKLSDELLQTMDLANVSGQFVLPTEHLPGPGVYSIRVIAKDNTGHFASNFSDAINLLIGP